MNLFGLSIILISIPTIIQLVFGSLAIKKKITFPFEYITLLCCLAQFLFIYFALKIIAIDAQNQNVKCGMPQAAMFFAGFIFLIILFLLITVQLIIRRKINKSKNSQNGHFKKS